MFAIFDKSVAKIQHPGVRIFAQTFKVDEQRPGLENLPTDESTDAIRGIAKSIKESYPSCISMDILPNCVLASQLDHHMILTPSFVGVKEDVICLFRGELSNTDTLQKLWGSKNEENNALMVIDTYSKCYAGKKDKEDDEWIKAVKTFQGKFSFVVYDAKKRTFFVSTDPIGTAVKCYWGTDLIGNMLFSSTYDIGGNASVYYGHIPGGHFVASGMGLRKLEKPNEQIKVEPVPLDDDSVQSPPSKKHKV